MTDNMKKFLEVASADESMQDRIAKAKEDFCSTMINLAKEQGIELTEEDINGAMNSGAEEVSDEELENVAGGRKACSTVKGSTLKHSECACALGGGGDADEYQKTCACVLAGCGELTEYGKQAVSQGRYQATGKGSKPVAMYCPIAGGSWSC